MLHSYGWDGVEGSALNACTNEVGVSNKEKDIESQESSEETLPSLFYTPPEEIEEEYFTANNGVTANDRITIPTPFLLLTFL